MNAQEIASQATQSCMTAPVATLGEAGQGMDSTSTMETKATNPGDARPVQRPSRLRGEGGKAFQRRRFFAPLMI